VPFLVVENKKRRNTMNVDNELMADAVFEGGGAKGIAYAGALEIFEQAGYRWQNLAGASAGAITAALLAVGYPAKEIRKILEQRIDYQQVRDAKGIGKIPYVGPYLNLLIKKGMFKGDYFLDTMRTLLKEGMAKYHPDRKIEGEVKFDDLTVDKEPDDSVDDYEDRYKHKLQVIVSDISTNRMIILPRDSKKAFGVESGELEVALSVRMSGSFPFVFEPVRFKDASNRKHLLVDGGMLSNFPISLFDSPGEQVPAWPTFGFLLWEPGSEKPYKRIGWIGSVAVALIKTMSTAHDRKAIEEITNSRIRKIPTGKYTTTDFDLGSKDVEWLCDSGTKAAEKFLKTWDFDQHKEERKKLATVGD